MCVCDVCVRRWDVEPPTRGPGSHSNNPYLLEHSYGLGVLAQRDPVSIRLRVSKRVEAIPPPPRSGGAPGGPRNPIKHEERGGHPPSGSGPTPVCAQRVLKTRPRRATILLSLATSGRHSAENTALPGRLTHSLFVKGTRGSGQSTDALDDARSRPAIDRRKIQRTTTELCHPVS